MHSFGETIKEIRKNKNIKQTELRTVSQSSLAHIESGRRKPRADLFENILIELNTDMNEFLFLQNGNELPERQKLFKLFRDQRQSIYEDYIKELILKFDDYINRNPYDQFIKDLRHLLDINLAVNKNQSYDVATNESYEIWERYALQKRWYHNDLYIMTKLFFIFPLELSEKIIKKILSELDCYNEFTNIETFKLSFLLNCSFYYISKKEFNKMYTLASEAKELAHKIQLSVSELSAEYCLAHYYLTIECDKEKAYTTIKRVTFLLNELNYSALSSHMKNDWKLFINQSADKNNSKNML